MELRSRLVSLNTILRLTTCLRSMLLYFADVGVVSGRWGNVPARGKSERRSESHVKSINDVGVHLRHTRCVMGEGAGGCGTGGDSHWDVVGLRHGLTPLAALPGVPSRCAAVRNSRASSANDERVSKVVIWFRARAEFKEDSGCQAPMMLSWAPVV